jgi:hypothetical protein
MPSAKKDEREKRVSTLMAVVKKKLENSWSIVKNKVVAQEL